MNHYDVLGVDPAASRDEIRRAYRLRAQLFHPDRVGVDASADLLGEATRAMEALNEAWRVLGDEDRRREYDLATTGGAYEHRSSGDRAWSTADGPERGDVDSFELVVDRLARALLSGLPANVISAGRLPPALADVLEEFLGVAETWIDAVDAALGDVGSDRVDVLAYETLTFALRAVNEQATAAGIDPSTLVLLARVGRAAYEDLAAGMSPAGLGAVTPPVPSEELTARAAEARRWSWPLPVSPGVVWIGTMLVLMLATNL